jgi:hypothetical protein
MPWSSPTSIPVDLVLQDADGLSTQQPSILTVCTAAVQAVLHQTP